MWRSSACGGGRGWLWLAVADDRSCAAQGGGGHDSPTNFCFNSPWELRRQSGLQLSIVLVSIARGHRMAEERSFRAGRNVEGRVLKSPDAEECSLAEYPLAHWPIHFDGALHGADAVGRGRARPWRWAEAVLQARRSIDDGLIAPRINIHHRMTSTMPKANTSDGGSMQRQADWAALHGLTDIEPLAPALLCVPDRASMDASASFVASLALNFLSTSLPS
jgi:hypothetical protein